MGQIITSTCVYFQLVGWFPTFFFFLETVTSRIKSLVMVLVLEHYYNRVLVIQSLVVLIEL